MVPRGVMVGRKDKRMPYSLYWMVTVAPLPDEPGWIVGYGNSPPARKLAVLLLTVTRFGSARISSRFLASSAVIAACRLMSDRIAKMFTAELTTPASAAFVPRVAPVPTAVVWLNAPVRKFALRFILALRSTSANRTFNRICDSTGGTSTRNRLIA